MSLMATNVMVLVELSHLAVKINSRFATLEKYLRDITKKIITRLSLQIIERHY